MPVLDQGLDMLGFQRSRLHPAVTHFVEFVGGSGQDPLAIPLCGITAFPALCTELFKLLVQVSNRVFSLYLLSVSDAPGSLN